MSRLRLSAADRERLGCPEFLANPFDTVTVREAMELQKFGYTTPGMLAKALGTQSGEGPNYAAWAAYVWLALHRAGVECDMATLDFDIVSMEVVPDEDPPESSAGPGKAPARGRSTHSTRKSSTSGETSQARSTPIGLPS